MGISKKIVKPSVVKKSKEEIAEEKRIASELREIEREKRNALIAEAQANGNKAVYKNSSYIPVPKDQNKMIGNRFWELRTEVGPATLFSDPNILLAEGIKYFEWCVENPLYKTEVRTVSLPKGLGSQVELVQVPVLRAFTWHGLEQFLRVSSFQHYKKNPKYSAFFHVMEFFDSVIYRQKFEGAAANLLDPGIISRDLGLKDKSDITTNGESMNAPAAIQINFKARGKDVIQKKKKQLKNKK